MVLTNKQGLIKGGSFADPKAYPRFENSSEWKRFRKNTFAAGSTNPHMGHEVRVSKPICADRAASQRDVGRLFLELC